MMTIWAQVQTRGLRARGILLDAIVLQAMRVLASRDAFAYRSLVLVMGILRNGLETRRRPRDRKEPRTIPRKHHRPAHGKLIHGQHEGSMRREVEGRFRNAIEHRWFLKVWPTVVIEAGLHKHRLQRSVHKRKRHLMAYVVWIAVELVAGLPIQSLTFHGAATPLAKAGFARAERQAGVKKPAIRALLIERRLRIVRCRKDTRRQPHHDGGLKELMLNTF